MLISVSVETLQFFLRAAAVQGRRHHTLASLLAMLCPPGLTETH